MYCIGELFWEETFLENISLMFAINQELHLMVQQPQRVFKQTKIRMKIFPVSSFVYSLTSISTCSQPLTTRSCPPSLQRAALAPTKRRPRTPTAPSVLPTAHRHRNKPWSAPARKVSTVPRPTLAPWPAHVRSTRTHHCNNKHIRKVALLFNFAPNVGRSDIARLYFYSFAAFIHIRLKRWSKYTQHINTNPRERRKDNWKLRKRVEG